MISIIIINYNTFELTCKCIKSIIEKTEGVDYEIILVDNASTECDVNLFKDKFPSVILLRSQINLGFAGGNNLGIKSAKGDIVLLLNSDTELINNAIKLCSEYLYNHKHIGAISSQLLSKNGLIQHCCQQFPSAILHLLEKIRIQKFLPKNMGSTLFYGAYFDHLSYAEPDWIWGTFFMFRKALLKHFPNQVLNEDFFMYMEDMQWCYQINKAGYSVAYLPEAKIMHYMGSSSGNKNPLMINNYNQFLKKYYSKLSYWVLKK